MSRIGRKIGKATKEIYLIDPKLLCVRLEDGSFLGPKICEYDDGKYRIIPQDQPLNYTKEIISLIEEKGWNVRGKYNNIENLIEAIKAAGRIREPLQAILDGDRLFLKDGHRRHLSLNLLEQRGIKIAEVPAIIDRLEKGVSLRALEYDMLSLGSDIEELSLLDRAKIIQRHLKEDRLSGKTEEQSKQEFLEHTGWKAQDYDNTLTILTLSPSTLNLIEEGCLAKTAVLRTLSKKELNHQEKEKILQTAVEAAQLAGKNKASSSLVNEIAQDYLEEKQNVIAESLKETTPNEQDITLPQPKPKKPKPNAKEVVQLFREIMNSSPATNTIEGVIVTITPQLWEKALEIHQRL
ncbi:hypothetical protein [Chroococcus sp. FPU101]|uniref:hypothetical protein n=1 Tax=Chroococcus sp. FPU101 TaxID=1974212 RepID=UPI001A8F9681|nr:hypothetical protein [Chroococcus sp. FPU101]GFE69092.1 hypothetical protein CFPU101_17020 [Chroococcus sp. FPU101]